MTRRGLVDSYKAIKVFYCSRWYKFVKSLKDNRDSNILINRYLLIRRKIITYNNKNVSNEGHRFRYPLRNHSILRVRGDYNNFQRFKQTFSPRVRRDKYGISRVIRALILFY